MGQNESTVDQYAFQPADLDNPKPDRLEVDSIGALVREWTECSAAKSTNVSSSSRSFQLAQYVGGFANGAPLLFGFRVEVSQSRPEAKGSVGDGQGQRDLQPAMLQIQQQFIPALFAFSIAILESSAVAYWHRP